VGCTEQSKGEAAIQRRDAVTQLDTITELEGNT